MNAPAYVIARNAAEAAEVIAKYQATDDETALGMLRDGTVLRDKIDARYAARHRRDQGEAVDVFSFTSEGPPVLVDDLTAEADEFRFHTPSAKAGVLHIRSLPDSTVLAVARDENWKTSELQEVYAFMESLPREREGTSTNKSWIVAEALQVAYLRDLIPDDEFNYRINGI